jgi:competence protein ComEA
MSLWFLLLSAALALVDVNAADQTELETLPGIGPSKAQAIIAWRTANGPFKSLEDLDRVDGIGPSTLANLKDQVSFGAAAGATASSSTASKAPATVPAASEPVAAAAGAAPAGCPVNINTAEAGALQEMPGIGATKAAAIVQHRVDHGKFASCEALDDVTGIGPATLAGLRDCCTVK